MGQESRRRQARKAERAEVFRAEPPAKELHFSAHSGPIPSPDVMAAYGELDTSYPARIMRWAEEEGHHRRGMELRVSEARIAEAADLRTVTKRSQVFGFVLGLAAIGAAVAIAYLVRGPAGAIAASVLGAAGLATLVWGPQGRTTPVPVHPPGPG